MTNGLILAPLGALYGALMRLRRRLYKRGTLRAQRIGRPVISVGNITVGGTGKTPMVEWVARVASEAGRKVCILTRGYGRADAGKRVLVSDGERVLAGAREGGDEPRLLAERLRGVAAVISDADRVAAARWAVEKLGSEVFILDDGFQHLRIARDLDLVLLDATDPWGGGRLLPGGRLREPLRELSRAGCLILTRAEQASEIESLRKQAARLSGGRPVILSRTLTRSIRPLDETSMVNDAIQRQQEETLSLLSSTAAFNSREPAKDLSSLPIAAFCAIGNPTAFFEHIRRDGHTLKLERAFPDHHVYRQSDLDSLVTEAKRVGARAFLTTAKDAVKLGSLRFDLPCYVLEIELEFDDEENLREMIEEAIQH